MCIIQSVSYIIFGSSKRVQIRGAFDPKIYGLFEFALFRFRVEKIVLKTLNFRAGLGQVFGLSQFLLGLVKIEELLLGYIVVWYREEGPPLCIFEICCCMLVFCFLFFPLVGEKIILREESYNMQEQLQGKAFASRLLSLLLVR